VNYHRIRPDAADFSTPFDDGVYGPTVSQFDEQMDWLKRHVRLLSEAELINGLQTRRGPGELSVLVTTDDGYRDNYTLAFPVLKKHGIPAIFFVSSDLIETRRLGWWDHLAHTLKRSAKARITYDGRDLDLVGKRDEAFHFLKQTLIDSMSSPGRNALDDLAAICEVDPPTAQEQDRQLMTWEQLRDLAEHGIAVGSHTHKHYVLSRLTPEQQRDELARSKALIQQRTGHVVRSIAYPVGGRLHFNAVTLELAQQAGYEIGFSFYSGGNRWATMTPFDVKRTEVSHYDRIGVAGSAILPELFSG
jgi:peptidoglycan/xylan/chitin deacetylase (PgdA/CDA1 family)